MLVVDKPAGLLTVPTAAGAARRGHGARPRAGLRAPPEAARGLRRARAPPRPRHVGGDRLRALARGARRADPDLPRPPDRARATWPIVAGEPREAERHGRRAAARGVGERAARRRAAGDEPARPALTRWTRARALAGRGAPRGRARDRPPAPDPRPPRARGPADPRRPRLRARPSPATAAAPPRVPARLRPPDHRRARRGREPAAGGLHARGRLRRLGEPGRRGARHRGRREAAGRCATQLRTQRDGRSARAGRAGQDAARTERISRSPIGESSKCTPTWNERPSSRAQIARARDLDGGACARRPGSGPRTRRPRRRRGDVLADPQAAAVGREVHRGRRPPLAVRAVAHGQQAGLAGRDAPVAPARNCSFTHMSSGEKRAARERRDGSIAPRRRSAANPAILSCLMSTRLPSLLLLAALAAPAAGLSSPTGPGGSPTPRPGSPVSGFVFYDENGNGVADPDETVRLPGRDGRDRRRRTATRPPAAASPSTSVADRRADRRRRGPSTLPAYFSPGAAASVSGARRTGTSPCPRCSRSARARQPNVYLAFGDSITWGEGSSDGGGYRDWLVADLRVVLGQGRHRQRRGAGHEEQQGRVADRASARRAPARVRADPLRDERLERRRVPQQPALLHDRLAALDDRAGARRRRLPGGRHDPAREPAYVDREAEDAQRLGDSR